jgi:hypothetical protein
MFCSNRIIEIVRLNSMIQGQVYHTNSKLQVVENQSSVLQVLVLVLLLTAKNQNSLIFQFESCHNLVENQRYCFNHG